MSDKSCKECGKGSVYVSHYPMPDNEFKPKEFFCQDHLYSILSNSTAFIFVNPDPNPQHFWCEYGMYHDSCVRDAISHGKWFLDQSDNAYVLYFREGENDLNPVKLSLKDEWSTFLSYTRNIREFLKDRRGREYPSKSIQFSLEMCFEPTGSDDQ